jgi:hypothetical protein
MESLEQTLSKTTLTRYFHFDSIVLGQTASAIYLLNFKPPEVKSSLFLLPPE